MGLLQAARRTYLAETFVVSNGKKKEQKYLVMFPDQSGNVYLLESVPPILGDAIKRSKYFQENEIMPVARISCASDGAGVFENLSANYPQIDEDVDKFFDTANGGLGIAYLLTWGFVSEKVIKALKTAEIHVGTLGQIGLNAASRASEALWEEYRSELKQKAKDVLGLPDIKRAAMLASANSDIPSPVKSAEPKPSKPVAKKPVATEPSEKDALISDAKALGIKCTKKWSNRALKDAILDAKTQPAIPVKAEVV